MVSYMCKISQMEQKPGVQNVTHAPHWIKNQNFKRIALITLCFTEKRVPKTYSNPVKLLKRLTAVKRLWTRPKDFLEYFMSNEAKNE